MNLFISVHLDNSLSRAFSSDSGFAFMMVNLSVKHKPHLLLPHTNGRALEAIHHFEVCWMLLSFTSHICFEGSGLFSLLLLLKEAVWFL